MSSIDTNDLDSNVRSSMIVLLNARLADALDLKLLVKQAHWNIKGPSFIALHEMLDQIAMRMEDHSDTLAERAVQLGGIAKGTSQAIVETSTVETYPLEATQQNEHIAALTTRFRVYAAAVRAAIDEAANLGDADSADIFTGVSRAMDKDLWFISAHAQ